MSAIDDYKFGSPYIKKISPEDASDFAKLFGEGSPALTELIEYCIINDISTIASCKGHPEDKGLIEKQLTEGYITFSFDEPCDLKFAYFIASIPFMNKDIFSYVETDRTITLYVPAKAKNMSEKYFQYILQLIKEYNKSIKEDKTIYTNLDVEKIIDYAFDSTGDEAFCIKQSGYTKCQRIDNIFLKKIAKCPASDYTSNLHKKFSKSLKHQKKLEEFINTTRHK